MSSSLSKSKMLSMVKGSYRWDKLPVGGWIKAAQARACGGDEGRTRSGNDSLKERAGSSAGRQAGDDGWRQRGGYDPGTAGKAGWGGEVGLWPQEAREGGGEEWGGIQARLSSGAARTGTSEARVAAVRRVRNEGSRAELCWLVGREEQMYVIVLVAAGLFADGNDKC